MKITKLQRLQLKTRAFNPGLEEKKFFSEAAMSDTYDKLMRGGDNGPEAICCEGVWITRETLQIPEVRKFFQNWLERVELEQRKNKLRENFFLVKLPEAE